jgi:hypothetical protein
VEKTKKKDTPGGDWALVELLPLPMLVGESGDDRADTNEDVIKSLSAPVNDSYMFLMFRCSQQQSTCVWLIELIDISETFVMDTPGRKQTNHKNKKQKFEIHDHQIWRRLSVVMLLFHSHHDGHTSSITRKKTINDNNIKTENEQTAQPQLQKPNQTKQRTCIT